jgi:hypothetical protein
MNRISQFTSLQFDLLLAELYVHRKPGCITHPKSIVIYNFGYTMFASKGYVMWTSELETKAMVQVIIFIQIIEEQ